MLVSGVETTTATMAAAGTRLRQRSTRPICNSARLVNDQNRRPVGVRSAQRVITCWIVVRLEIAARALIRDRRVVALVGAEISQRAVPRRPRIHDALRIRHMEEPERVSDFVDDHM